MIDKVFQSVFGQTPDISAFTPGRVNLIGEHVDYNGGMVLPVALSLGVSIAMSPREDTFIRITSDNFDGFVTRSLTDSCDKHWSDYAVGAIISANKARLLKGGADIAISSTLPHGAGLSSSAAILVGILKLARDLSLSDMSDTDIAILARQVENEFIGVPCGIMDQMAVALSKPGQALVLDTKNLTYDVINMPDDYHMAVIHSGQQRLLNEGRYKERADECLAAKQALGRDDICFADPMDLQGLEDVIQRRARHCISEHDRTVRATACLKKGDITEFGALMTQSHISMRDDFEISLPAIDRLVADAVNFGALGARLTGGGFGGCIVACVAKKDLQSWTQELLMAHPEAYFVA